jgi:DNA replication protein DnaC
MQAVRIFCRELKMPGLSRALDDIVRDSDSNGMPAATVLEAALSAEVASRDASSVRLRLSEAKFPDLLTIDAFDFAAAPTIDRLHVLALARGNFIADKQNLILVGPVGTGKTHLATAIGIEAAKRRLRVTWFRAADLVRLLIEAKGHRELGRIEARLRRCQLLVLDELGFVPFDREGGELLFNLISARHRVASTVITANLAFSEWPRVFGGDEKLTAALLDRLAENAIIIATQGSSFRARRR